MNIKLSPPLHGNYPITQIFGENAAVYAKYGLPGHNGVDWGCPLYTPVYAAADGTVIRIDYDKDGYGNFIKLQHDGYITLYAHLSQPKVNLNDKVISGQFIGQSGTTGNSTGPHLHFELRIIGQENNGWYGAVDPMPYLTGGIVETPVEQVEIKAGDTVTVTAEPWPWVRDAPTTDATQMAKLMPGDQVEVLKVVEENGNKWGKIGVYIALEYHGEMMVTK